MLTTDATIKDEILSEWEYLSETPHADDYITQLADSAVPIYTHEIIEAWLDLRREDQDVWREIIDRPDSISHAMTVDLAMYYNRAYHELYHEILADKESE